MSQQKRRLYRSRDEKMLTGVLGGIADHFDLDPSFVRLVYVLLTLLTGVVPGVVFYFLMAIIVPAGPASQEA